jgi:hypothetical protein
LLLAQEPGSGGLHRQWQDWVLADVISEQSLEIRKL